ncbi:SDR family NAD(P)-dependent oxidoreductase [Sphingobium vermicomposti]|uniref:NAD(P)-dependent dehydrogenase (Short-subunit alcohol dehydrogenase family) n=1 Tax=Sphingobium vermicomposti TaxID=529005 RepID=A0A846M6G0_9SPHN|nr:glucose 1-dehydrogenase [Sphingobium vermicomposti]NIJ17857.1 NAD(P)-dependent dehydrogenase (short-subunit alcohol dehydrogenase family) [Sphingobium vermicomposti]
MGRLDGKVALITGGSAGLGRVTSLLFAQEGAKVVITDLSDGAEAVADIEAIGGEALFVKADVSKSADVRNMVRAAVDRFGRLDILYNNAAIWFEQPLLADISEEDFDSVYQVNVKGVFLGMKYGIQQMLKQGGGVIVNCGSINCFVAEAGSSDYATTKGAVLMLTKQGAVEYAQHNIRINAVCPGPMLTPMVQAAAEKAGQTIPEFSRQWNLPRGTVADPLEVAKVVLFLASDDASNLFGASILADGGYTAL